MPKNHAHIHQVHDHEGESTVYYDRIAANFDHTFDGFLSGFFKRYIVKQLLKTGNSTGHQLFQQSSSSLPSSQSLNPTAETSFQTDIPRVLDIGCANGTLLAMLASQMPLIGTGLDISSEMVKVASQLHSEFTFLQGSAMTLPFSDQSQDLILCSASFHHFPDPQRFLKEAARVLATDGRLVIAEIHIPVITRLYNWRLTRFSSEGDVKVYRPRELTALFTAAGFSIKRRKIFFQIQYYELSLTCSSSVEG